MKTTRLTTHWDTDQLITVLDMLEELKAALLEAYDEEIRLYYNQMAEEKQKRDAENFDLFDDPVTF